MAACVAGLGAGSLKIAGAVPALRPSAPSPACKEVRGAGLGPAERRRTFDGEGPALVDTLVQGHLVAALGLVERVRSCAVVVRVQASSCVAVVVGAQESRYGVVAHRGRRLVAGRESLCVVPSYEGRWEMRLVVGRGMLFAAARDADQMTLVVALARPFVEAKYGDQRLARRRIGPAEERASRLIVLGSLRHFAWSESSLLSWSAWDPCHSLG